MSTYHLVRVGSLGQVGHFASVDAVRFPRRARVIVRTDRGLEIGDVLSPPDSPSGGAAADGTILRGMTDADELLASRLEKNRQKAFAACESLLAERQLPAALVDVEQLFDGQNLVFYFLGPTTPAVEALTAELAEVYDAKAELRQFAETLTVGCGPGCGTAAATGGGCTSCGIGCAIAGACKK